MFYLYFFFFNDTATTEIYTLSLHDALPICAAGGAAGVEHHAWESESFDSRNGESGLLPGDRQRRDRDRGRRGGTARAQRDDAGDRTQPAVLDDDSHQRDARAGGALRGRNRGGCGTERALARAQSRARHRPRAENRLRRGRETGEGSRREERHRAPAGDREGAVEGEGAGRGARFAGNDGAGCAGRAGAGEMTLTSE